MNGFFVTFCSVLLLLEQSNKTGVKFLVWPIKLIGIVTGISYKGYIANPSASLDCLSLFFFAKISAIIRFSLSEPLLIPGTINSLQLANILLYFVKNIQPTGRTSHTPSVNQTPETATLCAPDATSRRRPLREGRR